MNMEAIRKQYCEGTNCLIEYNKNKNGLCYIYCSSNALYSGESEQEFLEKVVLKDKYEWLNLRAKCKPEKEIFIRDVWRSWYVKGINAEINSYEKLISFLRKETQGYRVRCVGASSGGFIANILTEALETEMSYCFAGQFSLAHHFDHLQVNPHLRAYLEENGDRFFEYHKYIKKRESPIFCIYTRHRPNRISSSMRLSKICPQS